MLLATNPVLLGVGALFGGMRLVEDRKRKVAAAPPERPHAGPPVPRRRAVRGDRQADRRDPRRRSASCATSSPNGSRELQRTYTDAAQRAQEDAKQTQERARQRRRAELDQQLATLTRIAETVAAGGAR